MRRVHGYTNYVAQNELITWVLKNSWKMFFSGIPQALEIKPCLRRTICNTCEKINMSGDILNANENVVDQEDFGFTG